MSDELKACPFCGGKAEAVQFTRKRWTVECLADGCGAGIISHGDMQAAISTWNTRAQVSQGGEAVEVVCITQGGCNVTWTATKELTPAGTALMTVAQHQRILAAGAGSAEPVGVVLTEEQMGIGYDRRMGPVLWFGTPPPGEKLYTHPAHQVADDLTMVKVSRELLERVAKPVETQYDRDQRWIALEELRALLDKP